MPVSVSLGGLILTAAGDSTDAVQLDGSLTDTPDVGGSVRSYGAGRLRWVQPQAKQRRVPLTLDTVTPAQLAWLEAHIGTPGVWLRDPFGRRYFGVYGTFTATPYVAGAGGYHTVTGLTLAQVTRYEST